MHCGLSSTIGKFSFARYWLVLRHTCIILLLALRGPFTSLCQARFLSEQRLHTTVGWTILKTLSWGLFWDWACMRSWYESMGWLDFYFSKWSHSLKALIILTGEKYRLPKSQQEKIKEKACQISWRFPCDVTLRIFHFYIIRMDIQPDIAGERYMRKST